MLVADPDERARDFFAIADMKNDLDANAFTVDLLAHENGLTWLIDQQGHPLADLKAAYALKEPGHPYEEGLLGSFITQVAQELENFPQVAGTLAALAKVRVRDLPSLFDGNASLALPAGATLGLLAAGEGASGGFNIVLEKPLEISADKIYDVHDVCRSVEKALAYVLHEAECLPDGLDDGGHRPNDRILCHSVLPSSDGPTRGIWVPWQGGKRRRQKLARHGSMRRSYPKGFIGLQEH